jgi:sugar transferase (PEP-CTERM/EpsH1 system associated)
MRPDIVHTRAWGTVDAIMAARVAGISRVVHGEHGRHASDPDGTNLKRRILRKCFSPLVDRFVTVSEDLRLWLTKSVGIAAGKVVRIHNGVDTKRFSPSHRKQARQMMGIDSSTLVIGSVGRLDPVKDHYSLLSAFASIKQIRPSDQLLIVGDGPTRRQIEAQIVELGLGDRVRLFGERRDVADVLRACDIFALTSIAEGISNTILEAMATGLPLVATRVGGNPELIQHGVNGQLAAVGDVQGISAALESYIVNIDLRHSHGRNARRIAEETFSLERMASQYAQLYHELAGSKQEQAA